MLPTGRKNAQAGDLLKVSDFVKHNTVDGSWEVGTAAYEKRGVFNNSLFEDFCEFGLGWLW